MNEAEKGYKRIAHEHQRGLPEEEKDKMRETIRSRYGNMFEEDKQKLKENKNETIASIRKIIYSN